MSDKSIDSDNDDGDGKICDKGNDQGVSENDDHLDSRPNILKQD